MQSGGLLVRPKCLPQAATRLFCFPYAGAGVAAYRRWWNDLDDVEVCCIRAPGRESRYREDPISDLCDLAGAIAAEMSGWLDRPYAVYGHSVGALIGFEVIRALRARRVPLPVHFMVGASPAPHLPRTDPATHALADMEFLGEVQRRYESLPDPVVLEDVELRELVVRPLRADLRALETYKFLPGCPLECPISAYGGHSDRAVSRYQLDQWRVHTSAAFDLEMLPGGHVFLKTAGPVLKESIARKIAGAAVPPGGYVAGRS